MYGILFHTGTSGSEGTLGGLVESGRRIGEHLLAALEEAQLCSNDPVCAATSPIAPSMRRLCRAKRQLTGKTNPTHRPQGNRIHSIIPGLKGPPALLSTAPNLWMVLTAHFHSIRALSGAGAIQSLLIYAVDHARSRAKSKNRCRQPGPGRCDERHLHVHIDPERRHADPALCAAGRGDRREARGRCRGPGA
jgi:hypothetical protein